MTIIPLIDIIEQEKAKEILLRSCLSNKMSHAYLFRGPLGVGKKTTASSFATFINCSNRGSDRDFCGICSSCKKFASGNHPDYIEVDSSSGSIKINQIRELKKKLSFPPFEAAYRVVMLPDIHLTMRRKEVANSLLKTLEEPPSNTVFILTADETGEVLNTIMSRCQVIPFYPLSNEAICSKLTNDVTTIDNDMAFTLAAVTGGSFGRALDLANQDLLTVRSELVETIVTLEKKDGLAVEKIYLLANRLAEMKDDLFDFFDLLKLWLRDLLVLLSNGDNSFIINRDLSHTYEAAKGKWKIEDLFEKMGKVDLAKKQIIQNCNRNSVCEIMLWELL